MNEDVKVRWVAALRSEKYQQGTGQLRKNDKFCCWGVLCDLAVQEDVIAPPQLVMDTKFDNGVYSYDGEVTLPPDAVFEWAGLSREEDGELPYAHREVTIRHHTNSLWGHNDSGTSLSQIADAIEENL